MPSPHGVRPQQPANISMFPPFWKLFMLWVSRVYFEFLLLGAYTFMISMSSWLTEPLLIMKCLSLSVKILPDLKFILSNINKVSQIFYDYCIPSMSLSTIYFQFIYIQNTPHIVSYYMSFLSNNLCLLIRVLNHLYLIQ